MDKNFSYRPRFLSIMIVIFSANSRAGNIIIIFPKVPQYCPLCAKCILQTWIVLKTDTLVHPAEVKKELE